MSEQRTVKVTKSQDQTNNLMQRGVFVSEHTGSADDTWSSTTLGLMRSRPRSDRHSTAPHSLSGNHHLTWSLLQVCPTFLNFLYSIATLQTTKFASNYRRGKSKIQLEIGNLRPAPVIVHCVCLDAVSSLPGSTRTRAGLTTSAN